MNRAALSVLLLAICIGCGSVPTTKYYVLEPPDLRPGAGTGARIGVAPFAVDAPYDQDRIVYRVAEDTTEIGFYAYHRWASPLARMLPRVVAATLGRQPGFALAEPAVPGRQYDATLYGRVLVFEEVDGPAGAGVRLRLALRLVDTDGNELWADTVEHQPEARATDDVSQVVERMRTVLSSAIESAAPAIRSALAP